MKYEEILSDWKANKKIEMLWKKQSALWTGKDENKWLGWLDIVKGQQHRLDEFDKIQRKFEKFKLDQTDRHQLCFYKHAHHQKLFLFFFDR